MDKAIFTKISIFLAHHLQYSHGPSIVIRSSSVRHPPFSKIFSKTAEPIRAKFHMERQYDGGTKVCSRGQPGM